MFQVPGRFGGPGSGAGQVVAPFVRLPVAPTPRARFLPVYIPGYVPGSAVADTWGAVSVPAQPAPVQFPTAGDPALAMILAYLYAWFVTDNADNGQFQALTGYAPIKSQASLIPYNPRDWAFNVSYLPALYLFRSNDGGKYAWEADDWLVETSTLTLLWALPLGGQELHAKRSAYYNQFAKLLVAGIERARTPGFYVPGDSDYQAAQFGSALGKALNMLRLWCVGWRPAVIQVPMQNQAPKTQAFPCLEFKFEFREKLTPDTRRYAQGPWLDARYYGRVPGQLIGEEFDT